MKTKNVMFGLKGLHLQTIEDKASHTVRVNLNFMPFERFSIIEKIMSDKRLKPFAELLEWIYGYKKDIHTNGRNKRRAPSAGALYPNELLLLTCLDGKWNLLYYSFEKHCFYFIRTINAEELNDNCLHDTQSSYIFFVSAFWGAIQKYGVRGFRYCLLDAGFIGRNLERIYHEIYPDENPVLFFGKHDLHKYIPLKKGEEIVCSYYIKNNSQLPYNTEKVKPVLEQEIHYPPTVPCVSTNMIRVLDIAAEALHQPHAKLSLSPPKMRYFANENIFPYTEKRFSVNEFSKELVETKIYEKIKESCMLFTQHVEENLGIRLHLGCVVNRTTDITDTIELCYTHGDYQKIFTTANTIKKMCQACQNQQIMLNSAFSIVLFVIPGEICDWSHSKYGLSALASAFVCSDLYLLALQNNIGTTTVGGFSEKLIMELLQEPDGLPLIVQAFGNNTDKQIKTDAS